MCPKSKAVEYNIKGALRSFMCCPGSRLLTSCWCTSVASERNSNKPPKLILE